MSIVINPTHSGRSALVGPWLILLLHTLVFDHYLLGWRFEWIQTLFLLPVIIIESHFNNKKAISRSMNMAFLCFTIDLYYNDVLGPTWILFLGLKKLFVDQSAWSKSKKRIVWHAVLIVFLQVYIPRLLRIPMIFGLTPFTV